MDSIEVGARIAALRKEKGMTQKQLAESLHITDKAVSKWECGKNYPDLVLLESLAIALDTTPSELLGLTAKSGTEVLSAASEIYQAQKHQWLREQRNRGWLNLAICILAFAGLTWIVNHKTMWLFFCFIAIITAIFHLIWAAKGKDVKWFQFISLSFTAFTLCAFYCQVAKWVNHEDFTALMDVVPSTSKALWVCSVISVLINSVSLFGKKEE